MSIFKKNPKYKRIMLKFSGEALAGGNERLHGVPIQFPVLHYIANEIKPLLERNVQIGIIIGGGNLFRGESLGNISRVTGDQMGMLATIINALALRDVFLNEKIPVEIMSALPVTGVISSYDRSIASEHLSFGKVVIFAGGTGNTLVTTDTALSLRGIELESDLLLKATNVDGIYSANPNHNNDAEFIHHLTYDEVLEKKLEIMDLVSFCLCRTHKMTLRVYNMHKKGALLNIILGAKEGTLVD